MPRTQKPPKKTRPPKTSLLPASGSDNEAQPASKPGEPITCPNCGKPCKVQGDAFFFRHVCETCPFQVKAAKPQLAARMQRDREQDYSAR